MDVRWGSLMFGRFSAVTRNVKFGKREYIRTAFGLSMGCEQHQGGVCVWLEAGERSIMCATYAYY